MQDGPTAIEILQAAHDTLRDAILPVLPDERRLDGLMIANAIAMVSRALAYADGPGREELGRLEALLGEVPVPAETASQLETRLRALNRRLCRDIRAGAFNGSRPGDDVLFRHLWETTLQKLRESNPKHLKAAGLQ
jgi:hypothetical protein